jgi:hypothetical protein
MEDTCTATNTSQEALTLDAILEAMRLIPPDPLADWMRSEGFDPKDGYKLILPSDMVLDWGAFGPPSYVRVSTQVEEPMIIKVSNAMLNWSE